MHSSGRKTQARRVILASSSPRRRELLRLAGLEFVIDPADYEEKMDLDLPPLRLAAFLSREKAEAIAHRHKDAIVIAADTFILFKGKLLGKPHTEEEAGRMLKTLSGKTHSVITGFTVLDTLSGRRTSKSVETKVSFRRLRPEEIEAYIRTKEPLDKAGAYAVQGLGSVFVKRIEGDYFNVIGLPLSSVVEVLRKFGIFVL